MVGVRGAVGAAGGVDVVEAAFAWRGAIAARGAGPDGEGVVVRRTVTSGAGPAAVVVEWPVNGVPSGWHVAPVMDSVGAVTSAGIALVAPWVRVALPPALSDSVRAIAWWSDGVAAAVERTRGTSCVREVALTVAKGSDLLLSPAADGVLRVLRAPCGGRGVSAPRDDANAFGTTYVPTSRFLDTSARSRATRPAWLATALLALALAALLAEHLVRREATRVAAGATTT